MLLLPVRRLVADLVPSEFRKWVEEALLAPLNRNLQAIETALGRVETARLNVQVLKYKGETPTSDLPAEFASTLSGPCLGVVVIYAATLDAGGTPTTPVAALTSPDWSEVVARDRGAGTKIRIKAQGGLTGGSNGYAVRWLAIGA
jgi:hypothetical protein